MSFEEEEDCLSIQVVSADISDEESENESHTDDEKVVSEKENESFCDELLAMAEMGLPTNFFSSHKDRPKKRKNKKQQKKNAKRMRNFQDPLLKVCCEEEHFGLPARLDKEVPDKEALKKYYYQRYTLFSLYDSGILLDAESWFSVTPEAIAEEISYIVSSALNARYPERDNGFVVLDCFCGAGGNSIQFALNPNISKVIAVDIDPLKIELAKNNARVYGCFDKIEFNCCGYDTMISVLEGDRPELGHSQTDIEPNEEKKKEVVVEETVCSELTTPLSTRPEKIDCCFVSPPWGGPEYLSVDRYLLEYMTPSGHEIIERAAKITKNIALFVPRNFDQAEVDTACDIVYSDSPDRKPDIPDAKINAYIFPHMIRKKIKAQTVFFNDLLMEFAFEDQPEKQEQQQEQQPATEEAESPKLESLDDQDA